MTSRPLLTRVAELTVMTGPMAQVGWARASSGVTSASSALRTAAEGAAGGGDDELAHVGAGAGRQGLEERGVLGVDRDDLAGLGERLDQRAADDERLLVGEREGAARLQGGEGGREADGAGDAVEHGVAVGGGELGGRVRARRGSRAAARPCRTAPRSASRSAGTTSSRATATVPHPQPARLLGEQADPAAGGGQRGDPEAVGVAQHEVDGLGADRAGGAEDHDVPAAVGRGSKTRCGSARGAGLSLMPPIVAASAVRQDSAPYAPLVRCPPANFAPLGRFMTSFGTSDVLGADASRARKASVVEPERTTVGTRRASASPADPGW